MGTGTTIATACSSRVPEPARAVLWDQIRPVLLGHQVMETIRSYMRLNDIHVQAQRRKFSPGGHVSFSARPSRRRDFRKR